MAGSKLPPQAYTRDILAHAYEWLKTQPGSVRELASSADNLVALYLQSKRRIKDGVQGYNLNSHAEQKSKVKFKNELQNLSEGLKQFEEEDAPSKDSLLQHHPQNLPPKVYNTIHHPVSTPLTAEAGSLSQMETPQIRPVNVLNPGNQNSTNNIQPQLPIVTPQSAKTSPSQQPPPQHSGTPISTKEQENKAIPASLPKEPITWDPQTHNCIIEVKTRLNLSSENEALRALIALGYNKLTQILPK